MTLNQLDYNRESFNGVYEKAKNLFNLDIDLESGSILAIGEREYNSKIQEALNLGLKLTILEGFHDNCVKLAQIYPNINIIEGLVQDHNFSNYDIIWWYHGPEHLEKNLALRTIDVLLDHCKVLLSACPHGKYPQDPIYGNELELHVTSLYPEDFSSIKDCYVFTETVEPDILYPMDIMIKGRL